ncbi:MAG TPA: hypothetical protein PKA41_17320 [Verrucomicrobiota bacterium]|nr:hypothetical protein [Verrucomicrobiota bacterium]
MNQIIQFLDSHGTLILLLAGFVEQIGLPFPGSLFVVAAGALAASGKLDLIAVVGWTAGGCILADAILFVLGRYAIARVFRVFPHWQSVQVKLERAMVAKTILHGMRMLTVAKSVPLGQVVAMHAGAMDVNRLRSRSREQGQSSSGSVQIYSCARVRTGRVSHVRECRGGIVCGQGAQFAQVAVQLSRGQPGAVAAPDHTTAVSGATD